VDLGCFFFDEWAEDCGGPLTSGEDFAAGQVEGGDFWAAAYEVYQAFSRKSVDYAADAYLVDCTGAHGAGLGAGVEGAFCEDFIAEKFCGFGAGQALGVLGGFAFGADGVVAGCYEDLAVLVDDKRAEGMGAMGAGCASELDCLA
jgi:hypothetical protein